MAHGPDSKPCNPADGGWAETCAIDALSDDAGVCALVNGRQVALFRLSNGGGLWAIDNHDPFSGANVLARGVVGDLRGRLVVASPVYKQHFDLETGQCLEDEHVRIPVYPVRVEAGVVRVGPPNDNESREFAAS